MRQVDVIIPCYNYGRYLPDCVASVLSQDEVDVRVLVIDDASTDGSDVVARRLAAADPRIALVLHERNRGHIATYNEGIDWVTADYMLLLSADDLAAPGAFARALDVMKAHPSVGLVYGQVRKFSAMSEVVADEAISVTRSTELMAGRSFVAAVCDRPSNPIETATAIVRSCIQKRIGGYRQELPHAGDLEMWLRFASASDVARVNNLQAFVRIHDANMRHRYSTHYAIGDFRQRFECFRIFFEKLDTDHKESHGLLTKAMRNLAHEMLWRAMRLLEAGSPMEAQALASAAAELYPRVSFDLLWLKFQLSRVIGLASWLVPANR